MKPEDDMANRRVRATNEKAKIGENLTHFGHLIQIRQWNNRKETIF